MGLNLDKLRAEAEQAFRRRASGGDTKAPWQYMTDQERLRLRNPPPQVVTPAIEAQLASLRGRAKKADVVPQASPSSWAAVVARVEAKRLQRSQRGKR